MAVTLRTLSGSTTTIPDEKLEELRMLGFRGPLLVPGDDGYDEARVVQNAHFDRRPGAVIRCSGTADVIDAVNLAREHELLTAVRGGGHSVAGHCVADGALMIDLSAMNGVWVDPEAKVVRAQGGATWGDVDRETQAFGLVAPGGIVSTTGVAGLTLGGGIGWVHRKLGLACDKLRAVEIVTADGRLLRASATENEDLFWALRGGGGNFGVAVTFEFDLEPLGPIVFGAAPIYGVEAADDIFRAWKEWTDTVGDEVTSRAVFWSMPEDEHLPPAVHNQQVLILGALYAGDAAKGEKVLNTLREFGTPLADLSAQMPYRAFQTAFDPFFPKGGVHSYWKSTYLADLGDDVRGMVVKRAASRLSQYTLLHVPLMGGATSRVGPTDTAFGDRSAPYMLSIDGNWLEPGEANPEIAWVRDTITEFEPHSAGAYLNFSSDEAGAGEVVSSAFGSNLKRLRKIKKEYDPTNLFRLNSNIQPE